MKEIMISSYPLNIKAIRATNNGVYLYAQVYIPIPCYEGDEEKRCSTIEGRKIIYDLNLIEGVDLPLDTFYIGSVVINEEGKIINIVTEYNWQTQRYESYVKDEFGNKYIISSSSAVYPMNWPIDFKGEKVLMDYYEYDNETNQLKISKNMKLLNLTDSRISTIEYPTINNTKIDEIIRGEIRGDKIYLNAIHRYFHIPNILTAQELNGNLLWYINSVERVILDFGFDDMGRVYVMGIWIDILPPPYPQNSSYIARYIEGSTTSQWMIYKDTTTDMQIVLSGEITKPFISIVKDARGNNVDGVRIVYQTNANWIEKEYDITSGGGISSNSIRIDQVPPYEYNLTAICNECIPEYSSVTFTCCGKLKTDDFKQYDLRWKYELYNTTTPTYQKTIGQVGCALTAMATLINYYAKTYPELNIPITDPKKLNEFLKENNGYSINHDIKFEFIDIVSNNKLISNGIYNYVIPISFSTETELRNLIDKDLQYKLPVIGRVYRSWINPATGKKEEWNHFVIIIGKCRDKYIISDPGNRRFLLDIRDSIIINESNKNTFGPINGIRRFKIK